MFSFFFYVYQLVENILKKNIISSYLSRTILYYCTWTNSFTWDFIQIRNICKTRTPKFEKNNFKVFVIESKKKKKWSLVSSWVGDETTKVKRIIWEWFLPLLASLYFDVLRVVELIRLVCLFFRFYKIDL